MPFLIMFCHPLLPTTRASSVKMGEQGDSWQAHQERGARRPALQDCVRCSPYPSAQHTPTLHPAAGLRSPRPGPLSGQYEAWGVQTTALPQTWEERTLGQLNRRAAGAGGLRVENVSAT